MNKNERPFLIYKREEVPRDEKMLIFFTEPKIEAPLWSYKKESFLKRFKFKRIAKKYLSPEP